MAAPPPLQSLNLNLVSGPSLAMELTRFGTNRRASPCNVEAYLGGMFKAFEFPAHGNKVPVGPEWLHETKQDGRRLRVERQWRTRPA
jgi:hypothetical protein